MNKHLIDKGSKEMSEDVVGSSNFIKDSLNLKKYSFSVTTSKPRVKIKLTRLDETYNEGKIQLIKKTDKDGYINFNSISEGAYLMNSSKNRYSSSNIFILKGDDSINIKIPRITLFKKRNEVDSYIIERYVWEFRRDRKYCRICQIKYDNDKIRRYKCKKCGKLFCGEHRVPESHGCEFEVHSPSKDFRTIYHGNKTEIRY